MHGVLFSRGRLHLLEAGAHDTFTSSPPRRARRAQQSIAVLPPPRTMTPLARSCRYGRTDTLDSQSMPIWMFFGRFPCGQNVEIPPARRAAADEYRIENLPPAATSGCPIRFTADEFDAEVEDVIAFLINDAFRQTEFRKFACASCPPDFGVLVRTRRNRIPSREVARPRERGRSAADERHALAVFVLAAFGQPAADIVLEVGSDPLSSGRSRPARSRRARGLQAGSQGRSQVRPRIPGKHVRFPIDHVGVAVAACGDQNGYTRAPACAPDKPTDNPRLYGNSPGPRYRLVSSTPRARSNPPLAAVRTLLRGFASPRSVRSESGTRILVRRGQDFHRFLLR